MNLGIKILSSILFANKLAVLTVILLLTIQYIAFLDFETDIALFLLIGLYLLAVKFYNLQSKTTFLYCFIFLAIMAVEFVLTSVSTSTEKAAVFLYFYILTGIIQEFLKHNEK